jgi:hypothetical protein
VKSALEGLRVIDFCWVGAGALVTQALAVHGAEVVKIESSAHPDNLRLSGPFRSDHFHTSYAVLGIVLGGAGVAGALLQGLAGVVRKYSARVMLGCQNLGMALASILGALSPGIAIEPPWVRWRLWLLDSNQ